MENSTPHGAGRWPTPWRRTAPPMERAGGPPHGGCCPLYKTHENVWIAPWHRDGRWLAIPFPKPPHSRSPALPLSSGARLLRLLPPSSFNRTRYTQNIVSNRVRGGNAALQRLP